jgi:hypothetical protein
MISIRRTSGRALSGGRRYEGMVLGVGGEKVLFRDWESESTMEVMGRATMDIGEGV